MEECIVCQRISLIKSESNPYFVKEFGSGYLVLSDYQLYEGYCLLLIKEHVTKLHLVKQPVLTQMMIDAVNVGSAMFQAFEDITQVNYEILGNSIQNHVHMHIVPRRKEDPLPQGPIWFQGKDALYDVRNIPTESQLIRTKSVLSRYL